MRRQERRPAATGRLRVDPAACEGVGICAHLASSVIELDRWGFPVMVGQDLSRSEIAAARRAVRACPRRALWIEQAPEPAHLRPPEDTATHANAAQRLWAHPGDSDLG